MTKQWLRVALDVPLPGLFDYYLPQSWSVQIGQRVRVPFGHKEMIGMVIETPQVPHLAADKIKLVLQVLDDLPAMSGNWLAFTQFAADYYQRPLGEVILPSMPMALRRPSAYTSVKSAGGPVARLDKRLQKLAAQKLTLTSAQTVSQNHLQCEEQGRLKQVEVTLNAEQKYAQQQISDSVGFNVFLLHGVTGSGKTEVYLRCAEKILREGRQVLFLVPEINLTPQLLLHLHDRFAGYLGEQGIALLHSGLADGERLAAWVAIQRNQAKIILGTRMAIFAPLQDCGLIVIDEEHDASYKQQDGLRYSARDLAVWRARQLNIPVVLGSATPSLETWRHVQTGKYHKLVLSQRARASKFQPTFELIDTRHLKLEEGISQQALDEIQQCIERGQQALVFLNRRGYAPVLHCSACGWNSQCPNCSVYTVLHKRQDRYELQCHHCGFHMLPPRACPECGNQDLHALGRGTQKVEEFLRQYFPQAKIQRIDTDSTSRKGQAQELFERVHKGDVDILIGTQMVSKGHDFERLNLVCILNADSSLYAQDFRASERLFAQLLQVAGRAGRHLPGGRVLLQTAQPDHPLYHALLAYDFDSFADRGLQERQWASLPPFSSQTLISAQARQLTKALDFLNSIKNAAQEPQFEPFRNIIKFYDPVPLRIVRVANIERAQLLLESKSRSHLQKFLPRWLERVHELALIAKVKYIVEVDPLEI